MGWDVAEVPDQQGRTFVVTGANAGLGLATSTVLAARGAQVVLACRDPARAAPAVEAVRAAGAAGGAGGGAELLVIDLADLGSVRRAAGQLAGRPIDVLVNNAGIMAVPRATSPDGHELQLATNVLGPFALTGLLLPQLTDRVVWISSMMHRRGRLALDDPRWRRRRYTPTAAYSQSKLMDLMLAYELQRRFERARSPLRSLAAHPGYAHTELLRHHGVASNPWVLRLTRQARIAQSAEQGVLPQLYAATMPVPGGSYVGPAGPLELVGSPRIVTSTRRSHDAALARGVWLLCEELTGVVHPLPEPG